MGTVLHKTSSIQKPLEHIGGLFLFEQGAGFKVHVAGGSSKFQSDIITDD